MAEEGRIIELFELIKVCHFGRVLYTINLHNYVACKLSDCPQCSDLQRASNATMTLVMMNIASMMFKFLDSILENMSKEGVLCKLLQKSNSI